MPFLVRQLYCHALCFLINKRFNLDVIHNPHSSASVPFSSTKCIFTSTHASRLYRDVIRISSIHPSQRSTSSNHQSSPSAKPDVCHPRVLGVAYRFHPSTKGYSPSLLTFVIHYVHRTALASHPQAYSVPPHSSTRVSGESTWSACRKHAWLTSVHCIHPMGTGILGMVHLSRSNSLTHGPFGFPKSQVAVEFF